MSFLQPELPTCFCDPRSQFRQTLSLRELPYLPEPPLFLGTLCGTLLRTRIESRPATRRHRGLPRHHVAQPVGVDEVPVGIEGRGDPVRARVLIPASSSVVLPAHAVAAASGQHALGARRACCGGVAEIDAAKPRRRALVMLTLGARVAACRLWSVDCLSVRMCGLWL